MTTEPTRAATRLAIVMTGYLALATFVLHRRSVTFADRAVVDLLLVVTGGSLIVVAWLLVGSRAPRDRVPQPERDDWVDQ